MAGTIVEWLAFFLFIFLFIGSIVAEVQWLVRKGWTTTSRATGFVLTTDLVGICAGGAVGFLAFFAMFVMVMGPAGRGSDVPEAAYWAVAGIAFIAQPVLLFFIKRLSLLIFKIGSSRSAWTYSLVSSILIILVVLIPPPLFLYLVFTPWKL